jgi:hypothetical protein
MWVLHLSSGLHSKAPKLHNGYFKMTLHVGIMFRIRFSHKVNKITYGLF